MVAANQLNIETSGVQTYNATTGNFTGSAVTQYNVQIGDTNNMLVSVAPSATSGVPLISQGAASNPAFGTAVVAGGGTGATSLTNHGVLVGQATSPVVALSVGTNGQVLVGSTAADPVFATLGSSDSSITYTTGAGTLSLQVAGGTSVGKTLTADTGGALSPTAGNWNILGGSNGIDTSGSGSTITINFDVTEAPTIPTSIVTQSGTCTPSANSFTINGAGSVSTSASGATITITGTNDFVWVEVTGTSQSAAVQRGYIANNAGLVTITLPANFAVGDVVRVAGLGAGLWRLTANTGDIINFGSSPTSAAGSLTATNRYDAVEVLGIATNSTWSVLSSIGNLTIA